MKQRVLRAARSVVRRSATLRTLVHLARTAGRPSRLSARDGARVDRHPELAAFVTAVDGMLCWPRFRAHERCRPAFERLLRSSILRDFVNGELETLRNAECGCGPVTPPNAMSLVETERFRLFIEFVNPLSDAHALWSAPRTAFIGACASLPLHVDRAKIPRSLRADVFDADAQLGERETVSLARGEATLVHRGRDAYRVGADARTVMLLFQSGPTVTFAWRYDPQTLLPSRVHPMRLEWSRLHAALRFVSETGDASLFSRVRALVSHPSHHIRWAALRTALVIAPERARGLTRRAARDRHPHVRDAARELLRAWDTDPSVRERALRGWH